VNGACAVRSEKEWFTSGVATVMAFFIAFCTVNAPILNHSEVKTFRAPFVHRPSSPLPRRFCTSAFLWPPCTTYAPFVSLQPSPLVHRSFHAQLLHNSSAPFLYRICTVALVDSFAPLSHLSLICNLQHLCTAPFMHSCCTTRLHHSFTVSAPLL